jgi:hypothetical protein
MSPIVLTARLPNDIGYPLKFKDLPFPVKNLVTEDGLKGKGLPPS